MFAIANRKTGKSSEITPLPSQPLLKRGSQENHKYPRRLRNVAYVPCKPYGERAVVIEKVYVQCVIKWSSGLCVLPV